MKALALPDLLVALQRFGVSGPQLGDGVVQKPPPLHRPGPDQKQILRAEQHGVQGLPQLCGALELHAVAFQNAPLTGVQRDLHVKIPAPALQLTGQKAMLNAEHDELPVIVGAVAPGPGQIGDALQQVGLSLGIVAADDVHAGVKLRPGRQVVAEILQRERVQSHSMVTVTPSMVTLSPLLSFLPRMVHTSPLTWTSPS